MLVLLRHGESEWNSRNLFAGWAKIDLTRAGELEARRAGDLLVTNGLLPDVVHMSLLRRAIRTAQLTLDAADRDWILVRRSWRLNERQYGALQGKNRVQVRQEFGDEQFMLWRRSYDTPPPPLPDDEGIPLCYELDGKTMRPARPAAYLDPEGAAVAIEAVANQGKD